MNEDFKALCENGEKEIGEWMGNSDYAFRVSCENDHIEIAKWLYSLGAVDIHFYDNYAFKFSCYKDHKDVAEWLYNLASSTIKCNK